MQDNNQKLSSLDEMDIDSLNPGEPDSIPEELPSSLRRSNTPHPQQVEAFEELDNKFCSNSDDIFDWVHSEVITKQNRFVKYKVMKEGQFVGYLQHPLGWDKIQEMYGGGTFQVQAVATDTNEVVRKQTMAIAAVPRNLDSGQQRHLQQPPQQDGKAMLETMKLVMDMVKTMNPPPDGKKSDQPHAGGSLEQTLQLMMAMKTLDGGNKDSGSMNAILEAMKMQSQTSQTMFMEIAKMTQQTSEKLMASTQALVSQMNDKMERLEEKRSAEMSRLLQTIAESKDDDSGDDKPSFHEMQMQATEQAMKIMEMIDEKANQKAERLAQESGHLPLPEKPGMFEKMVEQALPMLAGLAGGLKGHSAPAPVQEALPSAQVQQSDGLPSAPITDQVALREQIRAEEAAKLRTQLKRELAERARRRANVPKESAEPETIETVSTPDSLPTATVPPMVARRPPSRKPTPLTDEQVMEKYQSVIASVVQSYTVGQTPSMAADTVRGIVPSLPLFLREASLARIQALLSGNGVTDSAILNYVGEVYANLNIAARPSGQSA